MAISGNVASIKINVVLLHNEEKLHCEHIVINCSLSNFNDTKCGVNKKNTVLLQNKALYQIYILFHFLLSLTL